MKVEEIKLSLKKNNEYHVQFGLLQDLEVIAKAHEKTLEKGNSLYNQTVVIHKEILSNLQKGNTIIEKGIKQSQELGLKDTPFEKNKLTFDLALNNAQNILKKLNA